MDINKPNIEIPKFNLNEELFRKYFRVLKLARTPTKEEFTKISLIAAIGVVIIGIIGFIIYELFLFMP
ncbi:MAG: protein translocase SEC61 complex subunit gamma [Euryarchaeota archaeon]|nr:protein translocase SEC61 complex subunit gamma [Euryarchaeota archaeon]